VESGTPRRTSLNGTSFNGMRLATTRRTEPSIYVDLCRCAQGREMRKREIGDPDEENLQTTYGDSVWADRGAYVPDSRRSHQRVWGAL